MMARREGVPPGVQPARAARVVAAGVSGLAVTAARRSCGDCDRAPRPRLAWQPDP